MARIKLGPIITDIMGSVGAATFQRGRYGYIMRLKPIPPLSETPLQFAIRSRMVTLQHEWQNLSDAERLQWNRFTDYSNQTIRRDKSILISGHTLFLKYQLFLLLFDQSLLVDIDYTPMPDIPVFYRWIKVGSEYRIAFYGTVDPAELFFIFKITSPRKQNTAFSPKGLRFMRVNWTASAFFDITDSYVTAFGVMPPTGSWYHYAVQFFSTTCPVFSGVFTGTGYLET